MKKLLALALALCCTGCPETVGQQCPPRTSPVGQFALAFSGVHDAGECIDTDSDAGPDGGPFVFTQNDAGVHPSTLCLGAGSDGGPQVWLAIPGSNPRSSDLLPGGAFHFVASAPASQGICGFCMISVDETFDGTLLVGDAGAALLADGGLPQLTSLTGSLVDHLSNNGGGACFTNPDAGTGCNTPCNDTYAVTGTPF